MEKTVSIKIDGVGFNASHYVALGKEKAIEQMKADAVTAERKHAAEWFDTAFGKMQQAVVDADKAAKEEEKNNIEKAKKKTDADKTGSKFGPGKIS